MRVCHPLEPQDWAHKCKTVMNRIRTARLFWSAFHTHSAKQSKTNLSQGMLKPPTSAIVLRVHWSAVDLAQLGTHHFFSNYNCLLCFSKRGQGHMDIPPARARARWRQISPHFGQNSAKLSACSNFPDPAAIDPKPGRNVMLAIAPRKHTLNDGSIALT